LSDQSKDELLKTVNRESPVDKIEDFLVKSNLLKFEIRHQTRIHESIFGWVARRTGLWRNIVLVLSLVINALMLATYMEDPITSQPTFDSIDAQIAVFALAIANTVFCALWLGVFLWNWAPIIVEKGRQSRLEELKQVNILRKKENKPEKQLRFEAFYQTLDLLTNGTLLYRIVSFVLAFIGIWYPGTYCFHLLDIPAQSPQVASVLAAVTTNGINILLTALLGVILIYIYSMVAFWYFSIYYSADGLDCTTLWTCTVTTVNYGIRSGGGIGDTLDTSSYLDGGIFWGRYVFDITFWIIIIVILLKVIFGIILDTFGSLRDEKMEVEEEIRTKCFICGISANTFQQKALGFKHHTKQDHNLWNYLFFFLHLDIKNKDEFTASEAYVHEKNEAVDISYFPIDKAICLIKKKKKNDKDE